MIPERLSDPIVDFLFDEIRKQGYTIPRIAEATCTATQTLYLWQRRTSTPSLPLLIELFYFLGYEFKLVKIGDKDENHISPLSRGGRPPT